MKVKLLARVFIPFVLLIPGLSQAKSPPELGKYPTVYQSAEGHTVTVLRLGKDESAVLIRVDGIDSNLDGRIFKHTRICENTPCTTYKYETKEVPSRERWWTLRSSRQWGSDEVSLYPPGVEKKYALYSGKRPEGFDAQKFYEQYLGQKSLAK